MASATKMLEILKTVAATLAPSLNVMTIGGSIATNTGYSGFASAT